MHQTFEFTSVDQALLQIESEQPWGLHTRIVVGNGTSREWIKDRWGQLAPNRNCFGAQPIVNLKEFVDEVWHTAQLPPYNKQILSISDVTDVIARLFSRQALINKFFYWTPLLKKRSFQYSLAKYYVYFDQLWNNSFERSALLELLQKKDPYLPQLIELIDSTFEVLPEVAPSLGAYYRLFLEQSSQWIHIKESKSLFFFGFQNEVGLNKNILELFGARATTQKNNADHSGGVLKTTPIEQLSHHSFYELLSHLKSVIKEKLAHGDSLTSLAIVHADNDFSSEWIRHWLTRWQVPMQSPQWAGEQRRKASVIWWKSIWAFFAAGMPLGLLNQWLEPGSDYLEFQETCLKLGLREGSSDFKKIIRLCSHKDLIILDQISEVIAKQNSLDQFCDNFLGKSFWKEIDVNHQKIGLEFTAFLRAKEYFGQRRLRPNIVSELFSEFVFTLKAEGVQRNYQGLWLLSEKQWVPMPLKEIHFLDIDSFECSGEFSGVAARGGQAHVLDTDGLDQLWKNLASGEQSLTTIGGQGLWWYAARKFSHRIKYNMDGRERLPLCLTEYFPDLVEKTNELEPEKRTNELEPEKRANELEPESRSAQNTSYGLAPPVMEWRIQPKQKILCDKKDVIDNQRIVLNEQIASEKKGEQVESLRVSALEDYFQCPFLYYARHVRKWEAPEFISETSTVGLVLDPLQRGIWLHRFFEQILKEEQRLSSESGRLVVLNDLAKDLVDTSLSQLLIPGVYRDVKLQDQLKYWLWKKVQDWLVFENERRVQLPQLKPYLFEVPVELWLSESLKLTGRIDRIDRYSPEISGLHDEYLIIDYKTGSSPPFIGKELLAGRGVQLLAYALAWQNQLKDQGNVTAVEYLVMGRKIDNKGGIFLKPSKGRTHFSHARNSGNTLISLSQIAAEQFPNWIAAVGAIRAGQFDPEPADESFCDFCQYRNQCGFYD